MKKIFIILFVFLSISAFAQWSPKGSETAADTKIEYFGSKDVWLFDPDYNIAVQDDDLTLIYFDLDFEKTNWSGYDPYSEGLRAVSITIAVRKSDPNYLGFGYSYISNYPLNIDNWALISDAYGDLYLIGGQKSNKDASFKNSKDGLYLASMEINLTQTWVDFFKENQNTVWISVIEFEYGDHLMFELPASLFKKIQELIEIY